MVAVVARTVKVNVLVFAPVSLPVTAMAVLSLISANNPTVSTANGLWFTSASVIVTVTSSECESAVALVDKVPTVSEIVNVTEV